MSFSKETKKEMCSAAISGQSQIQALAYGMALFSRCFSPKVISLMTESKQAAELYAETISALTTTIVDTSVSLTRRRGEQNLYTLSVPDTRDCATIFDYFGHSEKELSLRINRSNIDGDEAIPHFLRGVFLVCGNVTDPEKDYHLEFSVPHMNLASDLIRLIGEIQVFNCQPKSVRRKGSYIVYIKGSETISDILTYMGAPMAALEIVQQRIVKSVRNKANRQRNSDFANSCKTANAAAKQIQAINVIRNTKGLGYLSDEMRELAEMREQNPELSLRELGESLSIPISRSGVNHRLMKIMEIAAELEEEFKKNDI